MRRWNHLRGRIVEQLKEHRDKFDHSDLMTKFKVVFGKDATTLEMTQLDEYDVFID